MTRWQPILFAALLTFLAALLLCPLIGSSEISFTKAWSGISPDAEILFRARLPRVLLALLAGGALAMSGVLFQALMRDALATPDTLGVSSGASLGAVTAICFGLELGVWPAALAGASLTLLLVVALAGQGQRLSSFTLLLAGITINAMCVALMLFLQTVTTLGRSLAITRWLMGGIDSVEYTTLAILAALVLPAAARTLFAPNELPAGVITALLGGPFFLWLLHSRSTIKV